MRSPPKTFTLVASMLLHALVYVLGFSALLAAPLLALSLAKRAVWYMLFSLGVTLIWQRPGLHPMQETHPSEATGWQSMCTLLHGCMRVCVCLHYFLYNQDRSWNSYIAVLAVLYQPVSPPQHCHSLLMFPPGLYFLISLTLHSSPLCHSYWFCLLFCKCCWSAHLQCHKMLP